ncbi:MAG: aldolase [Acidobacteria bacterium]|nr:aldolase [Acidobacteriota bacterium]MCI0722180.1 aldolase [Acidobacteriota bacterium]
MKPSELQTLCEAGANFYDRGYAFGSTGNLSARIDRNVWITPTGCSLKGLTPGSLACVDLQGARLNANAPSKEYPFHLAIYERRKDAKAIVHLHSTYSVALSCLDSLNPEEPLPAITPYYFMRVAPLAVLPYFRPGSAELGSAVGQAAEAHDCLLLRNHGLIALGTSVNEAVDRAEELEETARLYFLVRNEPTRRLSPEQIEDLRKAFPKKR